MVEGFDFFLALLVLLSVLLSFLDALVDFFLGQVGGSSDGNLLLVASRLILCGDIHDAVRVDGEGDFNLRHATGSGRNTGQLEAAQGLVVVSHLTFALQDVDFNRRLTIRRGGEHLRLAGRDGGVAVNQAREDVTFGFQTQRQRRDVQQQHVLHFAAQHAALNGSADSHALIRVDALEGFLAGHALHSRLNSRDTSRTANQNDLADVIVGQTRVLQSLFHRRDGRLHEVSGQFLELRTGDSHIEVLRAIGIRRDERQVDVRAGGAGQVNLRLFRFLLQALARGTILAQVNAVFLLELIRHIVDNALVEVVAAQAGVAVGGKHFKHAIANVEDGHVERAAAKVVHQNLLVAVLLKAVRQRSSRRLVDDTQHFQTRDTASVLGRLTLSVIEVRRDGDNRLRDLFAQIGFGGFLHLRQDHSGNVLRSVGLAVDVYLVVRAHLTLDGDDGTVGVGHSLTLCDLTDHALAVLGESHDRRRSARAFRVRDNNRLAAFHDRHAAVRRTKVNTNNLAHNLVLQYLCRMFRKLSDLCSGHCCPNCLIEWGLVGHDLHHRVTENGLVHHVPLLEHHTHRAGFAVIRRTLHDGFLQIRVKLFAEAVNGCHA